MFDMHVSLQELMNEEDVPMAAETDEGYDESVAEVAMAETSMQAAVYMEKHALRVFDALESMQSVITEVAGDKGLTVGEATLMREALQNLAPELQLGASVSTQCFDANLDDDGRRTAWEVSAQAIGERLAAIWRAFVNGALRAMASIADFFSKVFSSAPKLKAKMVALKDEVGKAKFAGEGKVKVSGYSRLGLGGKMDPATIAKALGNLDDFMKRVIATKSELVNFYKETGSTVAKAMNEKSESTATELAKTIDTLVKDSNVLADADKLPGIELPGDRKFDNNSLALRSKTTANESMEIDAWSSADCTTVLDAAIAVIDTLLKDTNYPKEANAARKTAMEEVTKLVDSFDRGRLAKWWTRTAVDQYMKAVRKNFVTVYNSGGNLAYSSARAALAAVETMKSAATKGKKEDAPAA